MTLVPLTPHRLSGGRRLSLLHVRLSCDLLGWAVTFRPHRQWLLIWLTLLLLLLLLLLLCHPLLLGC